MLRDVKTTVSDGLLGFAAAAGDGLSVKIGASPIVSNAPVIITGDMDAGKIRERLGLSPLADAAMDAVQGGAGRIFCFPVAAATAGTLTSVAKEGKGGGSLTVDGSPTNAFQVVIQITAQGGLNTAAFKASVNGGYSFSDEVTVPATGSHALEGTGLTLHFAEAADAEEQASSFLVGDTFRFGSTAPSMTNGDVLSAMGKLKEFSQEFEFVHIVGGSTPPLWQAVSEAQKELAGSCQKPAFLLLEAALPEEDGDLHEWAFQMEADRKKIKNTDIQVCAAWGRLARLDGTTQTVNLAGLVSGRYAKAPVQESVGKTRPELGYGFPEKQLEELLPAGYDNTVIELLDVAGYLTFRKYDGLDGFYIYHTKMMSPDGSDYRYAEDVRVRNKIIREVRKKALLFKNDDIDLTNIQGELETRAKFIAAPLDRMVSGKEIGSYEIIVLDGHEETFPEDETMRVKIRYLSRGYIREIAVDLGRAPVSI
ncbi:DUF2586 domain-containing protein [uncultured Oscillibacter sp.]|jgi:hypothetical protein|uniref:DUF2586 domain-containing protein n=1 Tax=uncultured Oscillibacter sp. TaxID=876091 RepID=UPI0025F9CE75|nr:DUF2586 domain-containing protein [uncultured Oscillibacter sp.]